jgi:hypothetical protein
VSGEPQPLIVVPPPMGSERYPALAATPGDYVRG